MQRTYPTNSAPGSVVGAGGDRGSAIPYLRFVEVNLQILGIKKLQGCAAVGYPYHDLLQDSSGCGGHKDN